MNSRCKAVFKEILPASWLVISGIRPHNEYDIFIVKFEVFVLVPVRNMFKKCWIGDILQKIVLL